MARRSSQMGAADRDGLMGGGGGGGGGGLRRVCRETSVERHSKLTLLSSQENWRWPM